MRQVVADTAASRAEHEERARVAAAEKEELNKYTSTLRQSIERIEHTVRSLQSQLREKSLGNSSHLFLARKLTHY